jgi:predicted GTPase
MPAGRKSTGEWHHLPLGAQRDPATAVGCSAAQLQAFAATVNASSAEIVVSATPIDLAQLVTISKKIVRARYEYAEAGARSLSSFVDAFIERLSPARGGGT